MFLAMLKQNHNTSTNDDLGCEVNGALYRAINLEITRDTSLTPHSTVHFVMSFDHFSHAFQSGILSGERETLCLFTVPG